MEKSKKFAKLNKIHNDLTLITNPILRRELGLVVVAKKAAKGISPH